MLSPDLVAMATEILHKHDLVCKKLAAAHEVTRAGPQMQSQQVVPLEAFTNNQESVLSSTTPLFYQVAVEEIAHSRESPPPCNVPYACGSEQPSSVGVHAVDMAPHNEMFENHQKALCKPCYFYQWGACKRGSECLYCHFPHSNDDLNKVKLSKTGRRLLQDFRAKQLRDASTLE